jgi:hypothetical protein
MHKRVRSYEVTVTPGEQLPEPPREGMLPGPYQLETYDVQVDRQYLVVEVES